MKTRQKRKGVIFKMPFQQVLISFFSRIHKVAGSAIPVSMMLLLLLFFVGNEHIMAKTPNFARPSLLTTRTNTASTRSSDYMLFQTSARPTIRLKPGVGFVGASTIVVGAHFSQKVSISISSGRELVAKTRTDIRGNFVVSFRVPLLTLPGFNLVKAVSANRKQLATASFLVIVPKPSASLSPNHGLPGARIIIKGKNFTRKGLIIILFTDPRSIISSVGITAGRITASASGTINVRFMVPRSLVRKHAYKIQVLDIRSEHSVSFNFTTR